MTASAASASGRWAHELSVLRKKPLKEPALASGWHPACVRRFFGTKTLPEIELSDDALTLLAEKAVQKGHTVPGVQKKLSLHLSMERTPG